MIFIQNSLKKSKNDQKSKNLINNKLLSKIITKKNI